MLEKLRMAKGRGRELAGYIDLLKNVDAAMEKLSRLHGPEMKCAPGCDECCRAPRSALLIEGFFMSIALRRKLDESRLNKLLERACADPETCPFLNGEGLCVIYEARPLICRTHGAPLLVDTGDEVGVSFCRLNFTARDRNEPFEQDDVIDTIDINRRLAELNDRFSAGAFPSGARISFPDILRTAVL